MHLRGKISALGILCEQEIWLGELELRQGRLYVMGKSLRGSHRIRVPTMAVEHNSLTSLLAPETAGLWVELRSSRRWLS